VGGRDSGRAGQVGSQGDGSCACVRGCIGREWGIILQCAVWF
jgi:hypothetical protein